MLRARLFAVTQFLSLNREYLKRIVFGSAAVIVVCLAYFMTVKHPRVTSIPLGSQQSNTTSATKGIGSAGNIAITDAYVQATILSAATAAPTGTAMKMGSGTGMATVDPAMAGMDVSATTALYLTIRNNGDQPDKLIAVSTTAAGTATLHRTVVQNNIAQMVEIPTGLDIPAKSSVKLTPGDYHIMLSQLKHDLAPGDKVTLTLTFQSGTTVTLNAPVLLP